MDTKKITYEEMKVKQKEDLRKNVMNFHIYRYISTPFTFIFVKLGVSPNAITIASSVLCLIGFYFLSKGTYAYILLGMLFFVLFKILDMSDGEVARIQNKPSIEGIFFDRISHYVFGLSIGLGFGFGLYMLYQNEIYLALGFIFAFVLILENAIRDLTRLFLAQGAKGMSRKKISTDIREMDRIARKKFLDNLYEGKAWSKGNILSRTFGVRTFQGIAYSESIIIPILIILSAIEYFLVSFYGMQMVFYSYAFGLIPAYILLIVFSKIIWIISYIYKIEKNRLITKTLSQL